MNIITSYNIDEVFNNIKIKKPINFNNKYILNLYDSNNEHLLFQTPIMYIPTNYIYDETTIKTLDLCEYNDIKFLTFMKLLFSKIINKIKKYDNTLFENKSFYSNIITKSENKLNHFLRFKEIYLNQLNIYDTNNNPIDIKEIKNESRIKCIIMLRSVWINNNNYGFKLNLLQIQNKEFINNKNLFKSSTSLDNSYEKKFR